ncbi:Clp protease N-terminal domain-containing protein [Rhodococcus tibetensis]|uniref:Clp protease N-terminal domain-containing protein n=1 Tax=Rhodococcus tibetensis TaxID=2965064 RepID=A0ABT1QFS4_9NOCA|nr:Clp protease N-terminal domain-containing protein [Rhodococcus sp. FXJ9.536]MCQ4121134.1 Clp protease N-terminal domain-containing protein [Rhodococcus sp. FXJ9.536]
MILTRGWRDMRTMKLLFAETEAEADRLSDREPGAEHLLLASFSLPDGTSRRVFERLGSNRDALREAISRVHRDALAAAGIGDTTPFDDTASVDTAPSRPRTGPLNLSAPAREAFREATAVAKAGRRPFTGADIVRAVAEIEHGTAARALETLGLERSTVIDAARAEAEA